MTALLLLVAVAQDELDFRPIYKANQKFAYSTVHEIMGMKTPTDWEATVTSVQGDTATLQYKFVNTNSNGKKQKTIELNSAVGPNNLPNGVTYGVDGAVLHVLIAGITPGTKAKAGSEVSVNWTSGDKSFSVTGKGTVGKVNLEAKSVPIDWDLSLVFPQTKKPAVVKQKSLYSTKDFSMIQSEGTIFIEQFGAAMAFMTKKKV
jgi:hypothetical protein